MDRTALVDKLKVYEGTLRQLGITGLLLLDRDPPELVVDYDPYRFRTIDLVGAEDMLTARTGIVLRCSTRAELPSDVQMGEATRVF